MEAFCREHENKHLIADMAVRWRLGLVHHAPPHLCLESLLLFAPSFLMTEQMLPGSPVQKTRRSSCPILLTTSSCNKRRQIDSASADIAKSRLYTRGFLGSGCLQATSDWASCVCQSAEHHMASSTILANRFPLGYHEIYIHIAAWHTGKLTGE